MQANLPADEHVVVKLTKASYATTVTLRFSSNVNFLEKALSSSSEAERDEGMELENNIRSVVLSANADRIRVRHTKKGLMTVTIYVGKKNKRNYEDELEAFYDSFKGRTPKPREQLLFFIKQRFWAYLLSFIIKIGRTIPMIVIPIVTANIIDIVVSGDLQILLGQFLMNIGVGLLSLLLHMVFAYLDAVFFRELCRSMGESLRNVMVRKLQLLSMSYLNESRTGAIASKILQGVDSIEETFKIFAGQFSMILSYSTAAIVITLINCPLMSLFYVLFIPLAVILGNVFRRPIRKKNYELREAMEDTNSAVTEMLNIVEITRAHGLQKNEVSRMSQHMESIHDSGKRLDIVNEFFGSIGWVLLQVFQLLALAFSAVLAGRGIITIGMVALFQSYFSATVTRLSTFINIMPQCAKGIDACRSIAGVLCVDNDEHSGTTVPRNYEGRISFSDVSFTYKNTGNKVLKDFSLEIPACSSLAIVGGSGSGKTTLINLIIGFSLPDSGKVEIDGVSTVDLDLSKFRKHLAVVPQQTMLFTGTLYQNLTYGNPYVTHSKVMDAIKEVGLDDYLNSLPDGLDTMISEGGSNLSGGQKQRLSIARALLRDPAIIILDEPTSSLDNENELRIREVLNAIKGSRTIIMIAHRLSTIKDFDNIAVLESGRMAEQGSYTDLLEAGGLFTKMLRKDVQSRD